jgi:hypothetical protein
MCWLPCNTLPSLAGSSPSFQKFCADVLKKDDSPCTITRPCGGSYPCVARASSRGHAAGAKSRMHITTREHGDPDLVLGEFDTHSKINGRSATLRDGQGKLPFRSIVERRNFHLGLRDGRAGPAPAQKRRVVDAQAAELAAAHHASLPAPQKDYSARAGLIRVLHRRTSCSDSKRGGKSNL